MMKDSGGKRGSRSVDLPVRASSSSVVRFFLLGADQRSTLRGAPPLSVVDIRLFAPFPIRRAQRAHLTGKPSPVSSPLFALFVVFLLRYSFLSS